MTVKDKYNNKNFGRRDVSWSKSRITTSKKVGKFSDAFTFRDMYVNNKFGIGEWYFYLNQE